MDSALIICDKGPFGTNAPAEAIRLAVGLGSLGEMLNTKVIFCGDAVLFLNKKINATTTSGIKMDTLDETLEMIQLTELQIAVIQEDLEIRGLIPEDLPEMDNLKIISESEVSKIIQEFDCVFKV